ncbi:metallophosphoesterase [Coprobacillus sp. AF33-1AC]|uniref:metallophosphoesterase n=1 Tax=Coprobacillus sp. AF33-1AC TaxID=2292032 RepID=UPI000E53C602|nr:metallophosphoesterase [Coprobacillus sp. AF33-1AC]RHM63145.1 metallophosphoesterase [Coprobacillus sp. AF33-1AC]
MGWFDFIQLIILLLMGYDLFIRLIKNKKYLLIILVILAWLFIVQRITFAIMMNIIFILALYDLVTLIMKKTKYHHYFKMNLKKMVIIICCGLLISGYGIYNAHHIVTTHYDITIDKKVDKTRLLVASDIHLSTALKPQDLNKLIEQTKKSKPDGVVLLGDIYDEKTTKDDFKQSLKTWKKLSQLCPVYYVEGNHEIGFQGVQPLKQLHVISHLKKVGVHVLTDEVTQLNSLYLIGRQDYSIKNRKPLKNIISSLDNQHAFILLDHQPRDYKLNKKLGIDLELSGHTHAGQLFPLKQVYDLLGINDLNYGYKDMQSFQAIVTSGMGSWGFAMKTSGYSEMVIVDIQGK